MKYFINKQERRVYYSESSNLSSKFLLNFEIFSVCRDPNSVSTFYLFEYYKVFRVCMNGEDADFDILYRKEKNAKVIDYYPRTSMSTILFCNKLYMIGGFINGTYLKTCECFDLQSQKWENCRQLNIGRSSAALFVCNETLYAAGGLSQISALQSIEKYQNNVWVVLHFKLPLPMDKLGVVSCCRNMVIIVGQGIWQAKIDIGRFEMIEHTEYQGVSSHNVCVMNQEVTFMGMGNKIYNKKINKYHWYDKRTVLYSFQCLYMKLI